MSDPVEVMPETIDQEYSGQTEDDYDEEQDNLEAYLQENVPPELQEEFREALKNLAPLDTETDITIGDRIIFDNVETNYTPPDSEVVPATDTDAAAQTATTQAEHDNVAQQSRDLRSKMARRIAVFILTIVISVGALAAYVELQRNWQQKTGKFMARRAAPKLAASSSTSNGNGGLVLTPDQQASANNLLTIWGTKPEATHWQQLADVVSKSKMSLQSQMVMMGYIKNWIGNDPITWGPTEKSDAVKALVQAANTGQVSDIYTAVTKMQHNGQPLQRAVAADLCEHALAQLISAARKTAS